MPTGVFTVNKKAEELSVGSLVLVNKDLPFTSSLKPGFPLIRSKKTGKLTVSAFNHQMHTEAIRALDKMEIAFRKETGSTLTFIVTASWPFNKADETLKADPTAAVITSDNEHYTGYAVDIKFWDGNGNYPVNYSGFPNEVSWLTENAARFGYILRYPTEKSAQTGNTGEIGHYRYVGIAHASYMAKNNMCLEEYLEFVKKYSVDSRLTIEDLNGNCWSVYYTPATEQDTTVYLPKGVVYELSGNNKDGYIIAVKSVWQGTLTDMADTVSVTGVAFDNENTMNMLIEDSMKLQYTVFPENATNKQVIFSTSDEQVVTVTNGILTAVGAGSATVTITTVDGKYTASLAVTVSADRKTVIWIDPGHGCYNSKGALDVGAGENTPFYTASGGLYESDLNMLVAETLKEILENKGYTVLMTRSGERYEHVTVEQRAAEANAANADLFLSIHANSNTSASVSGAEVYHDPEHSDLKKTEELSQAICNAINASGCSSGNVIPMTGEYTVLTNTNMPSVLIETCHLTNQQDAEKAITAEWCKTIANAIAKGVTVCFPTEK